MAVITGFDPQNSVKIGGVPIKISGTDFLTTNRSLSFDQSSFYTATEVGGGTVSTPTAEGVELSIDGSLGSKAAVTLDNTFDIVFETEITFERTLTTLIAVDGAKIFGLKAFDALNSQTFYSASVEYSDAIGYYIKTEAKIANNLVFSAQRAIGPYNIQSLKLQRSEEAITAYVKIESNWIKVSTYRGFSHGDSRLEASIENSSTPVTGGFSVLLKEYNEYVTGSAFSSPLIIESVTDTEIQARTTENLVGTGDLFLGFQDGTIASATGDFTFTEGATVNTVSNNFDLNLSVYNFQINPTRSDLFTSSGGFIWDQDEFVPETKKNDNLYIPSLWDPALSNLPTSFFQSGHGFDDDIQFMDIQKIRVESEESWRPRLNHGTFFIKNSSYYLFSDQSAGLQLGTQKTLDGRSVQPLYFLPKPGVPISVTTLSYDVETGNIVNDKRFNKVVTFTGKAVNGIELDTEAPVNIDDTFREFRVNYNSNNTRTNFRVPIEPSGGPGVYSFFLPEIPLQDYPVIFTRPDIFKTQKFVALTYNDPNAVFNGFTYGTGVEEEGDWTVNYGTGEVRVWLDQEYIDIGFASYTFDYPAEIEFNKDYIREIGQGVSIPTPSDLSELDEIGLSTGNPFQEFLVGEFPILDLSFRTFLDKTSFRLFVYNPSDLTFDLEWTRVERLEDYGPNDKVYVLNSQRGTVLFGDEVHGAVPEKYFRIMAAYKVSAKIEYEPISSVDYWTGSSVDLNLSRNSLNAGFVYLNRKELVPALITLQFLASEISALDFTLLTARVFDIDGDIIPDLNVQFEITSGSGILEDPIITSNSSGEASTAYLPSGDILDMATFTQIFEPGSNTDTQGAYRNIYEDNNSVPNSKMFAEDIIDELPDDIYLFKIYDREAEAYNLYDNLTRTGGSYEVYYKYNATSGQNELVKPVSISGNVLIFEDSLPQSYNPFGPNYEPELRGFAVITKGTITAQARVEYKNIIITSEAATLKVVYSPIQKGEWTLPILPTTFDGSEIDRATYITINP